MANKNRRSVKIYGMSGYKYQAIPTIMLKGNGLKSWDSRSEIISPSAVKMENRHHAGC